MTQYIDKAALVAEIETLENTYKKCKTRNSYEEGLKEGRLIGYRDALHKLDCLEVKEADLNKEIETDKALCIMNEEFIKYLENNLKINIETESSKISFVTPKQVIKLHLGDKCISKCTIPKNV